MKNAKGTLVKQLETNTEKTKGKQTVLWDVSKIANGNYTFVITAEDLAKNKSTKTHAFTLLKTNIGKVSGTDVLIRQNASTNSPSIGKLQIDNTVLILNNSGAWYYVQYGKKKGYVYAKYINIIR
ncbi:SH3 domain-containing protein [Lysinibacillus endophyticus]|uniref:SH3 domain-containing protein n=1 Tax=Ureibacillus endophyticus TaxID=1978490 RepID=UPI00313553D6